MYKRQTLSRLVKKDLPNTKIIIISGYDDFDYARQAITLGIEQYLLKPISKDEFLEVLEGIRSKYKKENEQKLYYQKFENEIKAYEKNAQDVYKRQADGLQFTKNCGL